jgi:hypothetical protein
VVVLECCKYLSSKHGFEITYLPVDKFGCVDPADIKKAIRKDTILVTGMYTCMCVVFEDMHASDSAGFMYVCVYVCIYMCVWSSKTCTQAIQPALCMYVCMYVYICVCMAFEDMHASDSAGFMYVCMCVSIYVYMCVHGICRHACKRFSRLYVCMYVCVYMCTFIHSVGTKTNPENVYTVFPLVNVETVFPECKHW